MGDAVSPQSRLFTFPAQPAGKASRGNWFQELLDHPDCHGNPVKIQEAYESFRQTGLRRSIEAATTTPDAAVTPDSALIRYLDLQEARRKAAAEIGGTYTPHQEIPEISASDMNCFCIWARPDERTLAVIQGAQARLKGLAGPDLHLIPAEDMHLSVIEVSHRHTVPFLRDVSSFVGEELLSKLLSVASGVEQQPRLIKPMLLFDKGGVALSFVPASDSQNREGGQDEGCTYHHLRTQLLTMLLETGMAIDTCYTAPIAHVTIARFVDDRLFNPSADWPRTKEERVQEWIDLIQHLNRELKSRYWGDENDTGSERCEWVVGKEKSLEAQLGYIKFGRPRRTALMVGPDQGERKLERLDTRSCALEGRLPGCSWRKHGTQV